MCRYQHYQPTLQLYLSAFNAAPFKTSHRHAHTLWVWTVLVGISTVSTLVSTVRGCTPAGSGSCECLIKTLSMTAQHQPPHETPANGHCTVHVSAVHVSVVHVLLSRYVDIPLFTICALQYSDYVCNKTFNISCCWDDHPVCPRSGVLLLWLTVWSCQDMPRCEVVTYCV